MASERKPLCDDLKGKMEGWGYKCDEVSQETGENNRVFYTFNFNIGIFEGKVNFYSKTYVQIKILNEISGWPAPEARVFQTVESTENFLNSLIKGDFEKADSILNKYSVKFKFIEGAKEQMSGIDYDNKATRELRVIAQERNLEAEQLWGSREVLIKALKDSENKVAETKPKAAVAVPQMTGDSGNLAENLATFIAPYVKGNVDEGTVRRIATEVVDERMGSTVKTIEIKTMEGKTYDIGRQHYMFELVLKVVRCKVPVFLVGPAGSGKTTLGENISKAIFENTDRFSANSFVAQSTKSDLLGYNDVNGNYVPTEFYKRFTTGGVWLGDEFDNGNANVNNVLNAALANGYMAFPNGMANKHDDFYAIVSGNTYGQGADRVYIGRNQLDAANLDRFAFIEMGYDESLEAAMVGAKAKAKTVDIAEGGVVKTPQTWVDYITKVRKVVDDLKIRMVVSPRATLYAVKLSEAGIGRKWVEDFVLWKGTDKATLDKVKAKL